MRYRDPRRLRIISSASLLLLLTGIPLALMFTRPAGNAPSEMPGVFATYTTGLSSLGYASLAASAFALLFGFFLLAGKGQEVGRRYHQKSSQRRRNLVEFSRALAVLFGTTGLIIGSLAGLYAGMLQARPDLAGSLPLPFMTGELGLITLIGGGALYAAGRAGRYRA